MNLYDALVLLKSLSIDEYGCGYCLSGCDSKEFKLMQESIIVYFEDLLNEKIDVKNC